MQLLLDPDNLWLGKPGRALLGGDRKPVALPDQVTVPRDAGPITLSPLVNDFDREGPVTLISAFAALGTAVAETDGTISYTPIPGFTGIDSIVYEIADSIDQRSTGQVEVTVAVPELNIETTPQSTFIVTAEVGNIDITVTQPADFAGSFTADPADLAGGPVNLVVPSVTGTPDLGETLTAKPGLWIYGDAMDDPAQGWQWQRGGVDIGGATGASYVLVAADAGAQVTAREARTDAMGGRSAVSTPVSFSGSFTPALDAQKIAWWDASDAATLTVTGTALDAWADKVSGVLLTPPNGTRTPASGTRMLNGQNVIDFPADHLNAALTLPVSGNVAFHIALEIDGVDNQYAALFALDATNDFQLDAASDSQFDGRVSASGIGAGGTLSGGPFHGAIILSAIFDHTGTGQAEFFVSNLSRSTMAYTTPIDANTILRLMTNRSSNAWIDGAVGEVIITGDIANRGDYHDYLSTKWGTV